MDTTKAEYLPNELWLQIFSYLENADLLYAFNKLNKRFQEIITPYFNDIDLSEVSLKQFNTLMKNILLSEQDHHISSLTLKNSGQFKKIFYPKGASYYDSPNVILSKNIRDIVTLKLTIDHWIDGYDLFSTILPRLSSMSNLTDLHLNILPDTYMKHTLHDIFQYLPSRLTKLTVLGFWKQSIDEDLRWLQLPSNIKSFAFSVNNFETIYKTHFLQTIPNNVEELKISFYEFDHFEDKYSNLRFSTSLTTLHLELHLIELDILPNFLKLFTNQLKSLILIIRITIKMTSNLKNELESMIKDIFPLIETFQYTIYSLNKTITNSYPVPSPSSDILKFNRSRHNNKFNFWSERKQSFFNTTELYFGIQHDYFNINFLKLRKLIYELSSQSHNLNDNEISSLNNLFRISPNLKCLKLVAKNSQIIIELLKLIPTKYITKLQCDIPEFHHSFLIDLAQIIPHIRELSLERVHYNEHLMELKERKNINRETLTAKMAIEHVQLYYKELIHLYLYTSSFSDNDREICKAHEQLENWLKNKQQQKRFYSLYKLDPSCYGYSPLDNYYGYNYSSIYNYCLYVSP